MSEKVNKTMHLGNLFINTHTLKSILKLPKDAYIRRVAICYSTDSLVLTIEHPMLPSYQPGHVIPMVNVVYEEIPALTGDMLPIFKGWW